MINTKRSIRVNVPVSVLIQAIDSSIPDGGGEPIGHAMSAEVVQTERSLVHSHGDVWLDISTQEYFKVKER